MALLPLVADSPAGRARWARVAVAVMLAAAAANLAVNVFADASGLLDTVADRWGQNVALGAAVALAWLATGPGRPGARTLAAALTAWTLGNVAWSALYYADAAPPYPSPADVLWLGLYPLAYACVGLRVRASARVATPSLWLDGLVGALTVAALGTALVVAPIVSHAAGSAPAVFVNAANAMGDLLLVSLVAGVVGLHAWRPGRGWVLLGLGFVVFAGADSVYLYRLAFDAYAPGSVLDSLWVVGIAIMALAAWQTPPAEASVELTGHRLLLLPFVFGGASLVLLVVAGLDHVPPLAVVLAGAALGVSMIRTGLTLREVRSLANSRRLALTDDLTDLPNRRAFDRALEQRLAEAGDAGSRSRCSSSISTTSRSSTTPWATRPATASSPRWATGCARRCTTTTCSPAWGATSSPRCSRAAAPPRPPSGASPPGCSAPSPWRASSSS